MIVLGFFNKLFGKSKSIVKTKQNVVDFFTPMFTDIGNDVTKSHVVQEAISSITKHASKLKLSHYTNDNSGNLQKGRDALNEILQLYPNGLENGADFLEKAMYHWLVDNNVFIYLKFIPSNAYMGKEVLDSMWVIDPVETIVNVADDGEIFLTFWINNEIEQVTTSIDNVAVLKRNIGNDEFFGGNNSNINQVLKIIDTNYQGIEKAIKTSAYIRFIVESSTVLNPKVKKQKAEEFADDFLKSGTDTGGVIFTDAANKITQVKHESVYANEKEMEQFYKQVYHYFGTNEHIIKSDYTDQQWNSFYESTIEPFVNKLELELSKKIFSKNERTRGNRIVVEISKLQQMSITSRLSIIKEVKEIGLLSLNEMRELIYLKPIEGGDVRQVSLNYIDADNQSKYQVGDKKTIIEKEETEAEVEEDET